MVTTPQLPGYRWWVVSVPSLRWRAIVYAPDSAAGLRACKRVVGPHLLRYATGRSAEDRMVAVAPALRHTFPGAAIPARWLW